MITCEKCSAENKKSHNFCKECGADLRKQKRSNPISLNDKTSQNFRGAALVKLMKISLILEAASLVYFTFSLFKYNYKLLELIDGKADKIYLFLQNSQLAIPFASFAFFGLAGIIFSVIYMRKKHRADKLMLMFIVLMGYLLGFAPLVGPVFVLIYAIMLWKSRGLPAAMATRGDPVVAVATGTHRMIEKNVMGTPALITAAMLFVAALWQPIYFLATQFYKINPVENIKSLADDTYYKQLTFLEERPIFTRGKSIISDPANFDRMEITGSAQVKFENFTAAFRSIDGNEDSATFFDNCSNDYYSIKMTGNANLQFGNCVNSYEFMEINETAALHFDSCINEFNSLKVSDNAKFAMTDSQNIISRIELTDNAEGSINDTTISHGYESYTSASISVEDSGRLILDKVNIPEDGNIDFYLRNNATLIIRNSNIPLSAFRTSENSVLILENVTVTGNEESDNYLSESLNIGNNSILILKDTKIVFKIDSGENSTIVHYGKSFAKTKYSYIKGRIVRLNSNEQEMSYNEIIDKYR